MNRENKDSGEKLITAVLHAQERKEQSGVSYLHCLHSCSEQLSAEDRSEGNEHQE